MSKARRKRQKLKARYSKAREDAQLHGLVETSPEGARWPEKVDSASQSEQRFPALIGQAIRRGWAVPDEKKPGLVDELISVVENPDAKPFDKVAAFGTLSRADQLQHERDQQYIKLDRVLEMLRGILEAIRTNVSDPALLKAIVTDVLRFVPAPSVELEVVNGNCKATDERA